jgi:DEAD/DEAH box helicase
VATAQTGTGKTLAFLVPLMDKLLRLCGKPAGALILAPNISGSTARDFRQLPAGADP